MRTTETRAALAYSFSDNRLPFNQMDKEIDRQLLEFKSRANQAIKKASQDGKRRALGVALLKDTPRIPKGQEDAAF